MKEPLGKGTWEIDLTHFPRPATPLAAHIYRTAFAEGFRRGTERAGALVDHVAYEVVDGWMYQQPVLVGAPRGAATPPRPIFFVVSRLHPAIRRRARAAQRMFAGELWRDDVARWNSEVKPARIRAHLELLASDVRALDDAALVEHVARCIATFEDSARSHGEFSTPAMLPTGDLIAHVIEWTGEAPNRVLALLASSSPISAGDEPTRAALLDAMRGAPDATRLLELPDPRQALDALASRTDEVGVAARAYFNTVGYRALTGFDVSEPVGMEIPFVLIEGLRAVLGGRAANEVAGAGQLVEIRDRVPAAHRDRFDHLLACARLASAIRDERALFN
ncbi:MAG TPA: hypothetical protein VFD36_27880, partial [Kofleriaceae bacterium]|nr:hypothetical protein [Kofleriaceae bacterium]